MIENGDKPLYTFDNEFLANLRNKLLDENLSPATVNRWTNVVTSIVNFSYRNERISKNPTKSFGLLDEHRDEIQFWEENDVKTFLRYVDKKYPNGHKNRWIYVVYLLALNTGMRAAEIWGLKIKDIKITRKHISVERQFINATKMTSNTKGKNIRKVPCNQNILNELKAIIEEASSLNNFVFKSSTGTPVCHNNFRNRHFNKDVKESGVERIRFHDLRHTALTLMVEAGINLKVVQSIAGHADIQTTMKYVHLLGESIEHVADSFSLC